MRENPFKAVYEKCDEGSSHEKMANLVEFPRMIDIEMTNTCNFRCLMCPTGNYSQMRPKGFMSDETYKRLLSELKKHKTPLRFIRWGEPTLHPQLINYIRMAKEAGILTHLNTNGSKLDDDFIAALIDSGLDSIKFSFQGVDRVSYNEMRNIDFFEELLETIARFHAARGDRPFPFIHVSTTITYEGEQTIAEFRRRLGAITDQVSIGRTVLDFIDLKAVRLRPHELEMLTELKEKESVIKKHPECPEVFDKLNINWDGKVSACCGDSDNHMIVGDLATNSLAEIWRSEALNNYRVILADMRHDELPLCRHCYDYQSVSQPGVQQTT